MVLLTEISSSSSTTNDHQYDVFLSFRGLDTRLNFTNHLYEALVDANLTTFLDDEEIETGESLKPELETAIQSSRAAIIVLSKNYASSTWCLDELVLILEQKRKCNQIVIPIFYHVEPTDVRKQQSSFGDAISKHKQRMDTEINVEKRNQWAGKIEVWIRALTEVADLKGLDAKGWKETELIEEVVTDIHRRLGVPLSSTLPLLIGRDHYVNLITSWLTDGSDHTADILTVVGIGGIGKTSLVKYVFQLHAGKFHKSSFIEGINARCNERFNGLLDLQKQLYGDISKKTPLQVNDVSVYTSKIENALSRKMVFIVLDDIGSLDELDALLGNKGLHPGSKIIVTTKDASLTERCALFNPQVQPKYTEVLLEGLHMNESLQLLCIHAFKSKYVKEGYNEVSENLVKYCDGHPLAIEVLGRSLHKRDASYWEECIKGLKKEPHSRINKSLHMSFETLSLNDRELFKHIACFFVGMDRNVTETILNACDVNTRSGIINLVDRCLIRITWNKLMMHQLVQELGRDLVRQESPEKPWERSRLWCHKESFEVLKQQKGTGNIFGLALDMRMLEKERLNGSLELKTNALSKMYSLRLLQLNYVKISGSCNNISKELRWLCMHGFPFKSIPLDLPMENLVVLDMSHSNIESFDTSYSRSQRFVSSLKGLIGSSSNDKPLLGSLKILDLSFCEQLHSVCGFFELPSLEKLIISCCASLIHVSESIEHCVELVYIDLSNCRKLKKLPGAIGKLKKLETLILNGCNIDVFPREMKDMDSLQTIEAESIGINSETSSSSGLDVIPRNLWSFMSYLPISLTHLSLRNNNLSNKSFPMEFSSLYMLKTLYLDGNPIVTMPSCVRSLPTLETLSMFNCKLLKTIEHPPSSLSMLDVGHCGRLRKIKFNPEMSPLFLNFFSLKEGTVVIEGIIKIQPLAHVEEEVLCSLGWANLELIKYQHLSFNEKRFRIQMFYEFGIFSTIYKGKEMPDWITCRSNGSSISFIIPSSPNKLKGLNFCYIRDKFFFPMIIVSNITKNRTWKYSPDISHVVVAEEDLIFLSHWMLGRNEMESGDEFTISITNGLSPWHMPYVDIRECGVSLVFDDGRMKEDVLGYYKSWNHIIGGDLSQFQTSTGEYILHNREFKRTSTLRRRSPFSDDGINFKEERIKFRAFSQHKSDFEVQLRESRGGAQETIHFRSVAAKMIKSLKNKIAIVEFIYNMFKCLKVKTRSHLCFSLKLYTLSRFLQILYILLVLSSYI